MTATALDTDILTDLDFEMASPCEYSMHREFHVRNQPASWIATAVCYGCGTTKTYLICDSGRRDLIRYASMCFICGHEDGPGVGFAFTPFTTRRVSS